MEAKIIAYVGGTLVAVSGILGFFVIRLVRGYDEQIKALFDRTSDLPAIRTDIEWLKRDAEK